MAVNLQSISQQKIKEDLYNYLKSLSNWDIIQDNIDASTLDLLLNLIASFGTYETYKYRAWRNENYIQEAQLDSSIIRLARLLGYRLNRFTAPRVKVKLQTEKTLLLGDGEKFGSYGDYDIFYFGPTKKYEAGDEFDLYIGKFNSFEEKVTSEYIVKELKPFFLKSIDNNAVHLYVNNIQKDISHNIEDYVIFRKPVDLSIDFTSLNLFVMDKQNYYGLDLLENDTLKYTWVETDGKLDVKLQDLQLDERVIPIEISTFGTNGDNIEKVRFLAPLYFSSLRRMVTKEDHEYIIKAHELIKDCAVEKIKSKPYISNLYPQDDKITNQTYTITIQNNTYTVKSDESDTYESVLNKLYETLKNDSNIMIELKPEFIEIKQNNTDVCEFKIEVSDNLVNSVIQPFVKAPCCSLNCYYIKYNVIDEPIMLSGSEQLELSKYIKQYKLVGTQIILQPAKKEDYTIKLKISLVNPNYQSVVTDKIRKIINEYELVLNKPFYYGEMLSKIAQITILDENNNIIQPIDYVLPNQDTFNLKAKPDTYYKFNLEIEYLEPGD